MFGVGLLPPLLVVTTLIVGGMVCLGMGNGAVFQLVPLRFRKEIGILTGIVGAAGGFGGFFLPTALGFLKDSVGTYGAGFMVFAIASISALAVLRIVQRGWSFVRLVPSINGLEAKMVVSNAGSE
jgi:NNP family nitrate/nitrite transporter-like MFS transporter